MYLEAFPRGDQAMKVVRYDLYDTAGPSGPLSGTSCPPQPHMEVKRTPPFLTYLEAFPRGDHSMKVSYCNLLDTPGPPPSFTRSNLPPNHPNQPTECIVGTSLSLLVITKFSGVLI